MRRYELTDEACLRLESLMPTDKHGGQWNDHRTTLNGFFWVLNSGAPWRDMPDRYGKWQSVYHRYRRWSHQTEPRVESKFEGGSPLFEAVLLASLADFSLWLTR